jgi:biotin synthase
MSIKQWTLDEMELIYDQSFFPLIFQAYEVHRQHFPDHDIDLSQLLSIKTGTCPEDCAYCNQSGHHQTTVEKENLLDLDVVLAQAKIAKENGAKRFCMGAAWRQPPAKQFPKVLEMIKEVKAMGLETCVTLGMLDDEQVSELKTAGLDYYNHNLDSSPEYYEKIITTRTYQERLDTLTRVGEAGIHVCCGAIIGMGETKIDRFKFLLQLAQLETPPTSIPINRLVPFAGTPLAHVVQIDNFDFIRMIALTRIMFPTARVRLSAGREGMNDEMQAWCFMAGANSIHYGETLLTATNPTAEHDLVLLKKLGLSPTSQAADESGEAMHERLLAACCEKSAVAASKSCCN